jgi:hypothetical protein
MKLSRLKSLILGFFVLFTFAAFAPTTAEAQTRRTVRRPRRVIVYRPYYNPFWYRRYDPFWDSYYHPRTVVVDPVAYQRELGYREGKGEGEEDAEKGRPANSKGHEDYLKSDSLHFRESFVVGYEEGYREELVETTRKMREKGQSKGREDARKGRPADPASHKDYLKAASQTYRRAFVEGYNEFYRAQAGQGLDRDVE